MHEIDGYERLGGADEAHSRKTLENPRSEHRAYRSTFTAGNLAPLQTLITVNLVQKGPSSATNSEETGTDLPEVARVNRHGGYLATKEPI